jgi:LysR family nitrogen assimilation transcriptional regulator
MNELLGKPGGNVSVGLLPTVARLTASQLVRHFRATYPHAHISISEGLSANLTEWLMDGRIDVAVLYDTQHTPMIDKKPLFKQELFLIGPPGSSGERGHIQFARIGEVPLIVPGRIHGVRQTIEAVAAQVGIPLNIALEIDAVSTIFDMVQEGLGHAVQPMSVIRNDRQKRSFSIRSFKDPTPTLQLVLATSRRHPPSRLAEKISEMLEGLLSSSDMREP